MPTVKDMVIEALTQQGYDGLYDPDGDCACLVDDLFPCDGGELNCRAGVKAPCPEDCGGHDWHVEERET